MEKLQNGVVNQRTGVANMELLKCAVASKCGKDGGRPLVAAVRSHGEADQSERGVGGQHVPQRSRRWDRL